MQNIKTEVCQVRMSVGVGGINHDNSRSSEGYERDESSHNLVEHQSCSENCWQKQENAQLCSEFLKSLKDFTEKVNIS